MDFGILAFRLVIGGLFVGHGAQKLFGSFGGEGIEGTTRMVRALGYRPAPAMARVAGATELAAGVLLAAGFMTPLGSAMIVGVMINAIWAAHRNQGLWAARGGYELPLVMAASASVIAFTGPGVYSLDEVTTLNTGGLITGLLAVLIGASAGVLALNTRKPSASSIASRRWSRPA